MKTLSARVDRIAAHPAWSFGLVPAGLLALPWLTGLSDASYLASAGVIAVGAGLASILVSPGGRRVFLGLFAIAWGVRLAVHPLLFAWSAAAGGPFLGPDSSTYFQAALGLAGNGFRTEGHPAVALGGYDCAPYYLFAALIRVTGPDLYALQTFNAGLIALAAPLLYAALRRVRPEAAAPLGLAMALYPSFVALGVNDLLKDPSVIAATLTVVWACAELAAGRRALPSVALAVGAAIALGYLRMARVYVPAFLEIGLVAALWASVVKTGRFPGRAALWIGPVVAAAEVVPWRLGWPPTPLMMVAQVTHALGASALVRYAPGLADGLGPITFLSNVVRRLLGPFPWVPPPALDARTITTGDYLLAPGVLVWYAVMPLGLAGLAIVARRLKNGMPAQTALVALAGFVLPMLLLYLGLNLSYRQREFLVPFFLVFALVGYETLGHAARWRRGYAGYWILLATGATTHVALRAWLR